MKQINTNEDLINIGNSNISIILFGTIEDCRPCSKTKMVLDEFENTDEFKAQYFLCSNIDIMVERGYNRVPMVLLISPNIKIELDDRDILTDIEKMRKWIKEQLEK